MPPKKKEKAAEDSPSKNKKEVVKKVPKEKPKDPLQLLTENVQQLTERVEALELQNEEKNEKLEEQATENKGFKKGIKSLSKSAEEFKEEIEGKLKELNENVDEKLKTVADGSKIIPGAIAAQIRHVMPDSVIADTVNNFQALIDLRQTFKPFKYDLTEFEKTLRRCEDRGLYTESASHLYMGQWRMTDNLKHGRGTWLRNYKDGDGDLYEGYFKDGKREGTGRMFYYDGSTFEGEWQADTWNGHGALYFKNGNKYAGNFINGVMEGNGSMIYPNGTKYLGLWKANKKHGHGTVYDETGNVTEEGQWEEGTKK